MQVREGVVAAAVLVDRADTGRLLQTNLDELRRSLEDQGLSIQHFSVDVRGEAGANAGSDGRDRGNSASNRSDTSLAGALAATPGLTGDREVHLDDVHDGDVSILA
jgi:flagellar hook-length control protein FliK